MGIGKFLLAVPQPNVSSTIFVAPICWRNLPDSGPRSNPLHRNRQTPVYVLHIVGAIQASSCIRTKPLAPFPSGLNVIGDGQTTTTSKNTGDSYFQNARIVKLSVRGVVNCGCEIGYLWCPLDKYWGGKCLKYFGPQ